jgi:hypothetical protein
MADLEDRLDALVKGVITPTLKPRGYAKQRLAWTRKGSDTVQSITLQRSHGNSPGPLRFYVDVGAYVPAFARTIGATVPENLAKGTPQYQQRFEGICDWPDQWIDLENWSDEDLFPAFETALMVLDEHLAGIAGPTELAEVLRTSGSGLNLDLFAWWCATGDTDQISEQVATARAGFGHEERWPRLYAQFERVAEKFGVALP